MVRYLRYGNTFICCSHCYRSKAIGRAVDLPARSFDLARPGVAPPLLFCRPTNSVKALKANILITPTILTAGNRCRPLKKIAISNLPMQTSDNFNAS